MENAVDVERKPDLTDDDESDRLYHDSTLVMPMISSARMFTCMGLILRRLRLVSIRDRPSNGSRWTDGECVLTSRKDDAR